MIDELLFILPYDQPQTNSIADCLNMRILLIFS